MNERETEILNWQHGKMYEIDRERRDKNRDRQRKMHRETETVCFV